ncbi:MULTISPECIES: protease modulator HflC [Altererythrobacter]|uniref:Protein HflC n=1 Tax=Altererythrobacter ishigakiensis TaxID=476157 RepID=A0A562UUF9_9SPHN|nr:MULTISPECIES: protease modulator HflC [Altererythrobacter]MBO6609322.1 protease modulator HflC [Altererythrobacter sp.]MBO6640677.1 protease modulator HflC [Altererythrobacter sp.]MBO6708625.1 protease modulator HflC [Altererythrobacter sp.]MBO6945237.1 protease modulator HflC [Altererythrobacter sp.]TWJ09272.1 protease FtsH subunit HflC [Altererythrobacter ishigakiensis]
MENIWQDYKAVVIGVFVLIAAAFASLFVVPEDKQAVVIQTGNPVKVVNIFRPNVPFGETKSGLYYRIPLIQQVQMVERRILDLDMERQEVLTSDQQRLQVDAYARFRIIDPVQMIENAGTEENVRLQLAPILTSVLRQELGRRTFASLLTAERGTAMQRIRDTLDTQARQYGAQVIDVQIKRADLPEGTPLTAAFTRMQSDRQEEAETIRAQGRKNAQIIRAEAEAQAAATYADAYGKDPEFYDFYRAMESYRRTFEQGTGDSSMILDQDSEYFRQFRGRR